MVRRLEGWEKRYSNYLLERKKIPFEWKINDCMQFVSHGVEIVTGHNFYEPYSDYNDEDSAKKILSENGGVLGIIKKCLGEGSSNYLKAKRADVVVFRDNTLVGGLVADCGQKIIAISEDGWIKLPLSKAYRVWSY